VQAKKIREEIVTLNILSLKEFKLKIKEIIWKFV
jgi:hypothetical protein